MERENIRHLSTVEEFSELLSVQKQIWELADMDAVPVHTLKTVSGQTLPIIPLIKKAYTFFKNQPQIRGN